MATEDSLRVGRWVPGAEPDRTPAEPDRPAVAGTAPADRDADTVVVDPLGFRDPLRPPPRGLAAAGAPAGTGDGATHDGATGDGATGDGALDPWDVLPAPGSGTGPDADSETGPELAADRIGRYRGRRRQPSRSGVRAARWTVTGVVAAVATVLIGSAVLADYLSDPVTLPVVPPSPPTPSVSPVPTEAPARVPAPSRQGVAPVPTPVVTSPEPPPEPPPPAGPVSLTFEAEAAQLGGGVEVAGLDAASGDQVVRMFGGCTCLTVTFTDVTVDSSGEYQLTLHHGRFEFEDRFDRTAEVVVNGRPPVRIELESPRRGEVESVGLPVELSEGDNTIVVTGVQRRAAPNLDRVTVTE